MEIELASTQIITQGAELSEGWKVFVSIPDQLSFGRIFVPVSLFLKNGDRRFDPKSMQEVKLEVSHLPHAHKSKPIDQLLKSSRTSDGLAGKNPKTLAKLISLEGHLAVYYRPNGFEFEREPRFGLTFTLERFNSVWHGKAEELNGSLTPLA